MPIIKSAKKAARQTTARTAHNQQIKKDIKTALKAFQSSPSATSFAKIQSEIDKAVKKGLIKKNTASRRKAHLAKIAKAAGVKSTATKTAKAPKTAAKPTIKTTKPAAKTAKTAKPATKKSTTAKAATKTPSPKSKADKK